MTSHQIVLRHCLLYKSRCCILRRLPRSLFRYYTNKRCTFHLLTTSYLLPFICLFPVLFPLNVSHCRANLSCKNWNRCFVCVVATISCQFVNDSLCKSCSTYQHQSWLQRQKFASGGVTLGGGVGGPPPHLFWRGGRTPHFLRPLGSKILQVQNTMSTTGL